MAKRKVYDPLLPIAPLLNLIREALLEQPECTQRDFARKFAAWTGMQEKSAERQLSRMLSGREYIKMANADDWCLFLGTSLFTVYPAEMDSIHPV